MPLDKDILDAAVKTAREYKDNGFKPSEIRAELKKEKYKVDEVDEIMDALYEASPSPEYQKRQEYNPDLEPDPNEPNKPVTTKTKGLNRDYQLYSVEPKYENIHDETGKAIGRKLVSYDKLKRIRFTRVTEKVANELNSQSENTRERLFLVDEDEKGDE